MIVKPIKLTTLIFAFLFLFYEAMSQNSLAFKEVSLEAKASYFSGFKEEIVPITKWVSGGVACTDFNNDNYLDLYLIGGDSVDNVLLKNNGDGTFSDVTELMGLMNLKGQDSGPLFFDYNLDGWQDLIVGSVSGQSPKLYENSLGSYFYEANTFEEIGGNTVSISAGDYNQDGFVDLFMCRWLEPASNNNLWKNNGNGSFTNENQLLDDFPKYTTDYSFTANFTDVNLDGKKDLLIASDFKSSQVLINDGVKFVNQRSSQISDENGMGASVGDFDNDGDFDWFVSSIYDHDGVTEGNWGASGNRLYVNDNGRYIDKTSGSGIRNGSWGWGSTFADLNNDGLLDIVQVNGWPQGSKQFRNDSTRIFIATEPGKFEDQSMETGFLDTGQGRGVVTFDYDNDGDLDVFITNYNGTSKLWRNDYAGPNNWITVNLKPSLAHPNIEGSIIEVYLDGICQTKQVTYGSNYMSQNPLRCHFGIGTRQMVDSIKVIWPNKDMLIRYSVNANQLLHLTSDLILGEDEIKDTQNEIVAYPNPFAENLTIGLNSGFNEAIEILNFEGKRIMKLEPGWHPGSWKQYRLNSEHFPSGVYFVRSSKSKKQIRIIKN